MIPEYLKLKCFKIFLTVSSKEFFSVYSCESVLCIVHAMSSILMASPLKEHAMKQTFQQINSNILPLVNVVSDFKFCVFMHLLYLFYSFSKAGTKSIRHNTFNFSFIKSFSIVRSHFLYQN